MSCLLKPAPLAAGLLAALLLGASAAHAASSAACEPIRSRIEANIRAKGITDFRVRVADAGAKEPGRRVGDCEGGRKVILYTRGEAPITAEPLAPTAPIRSTSRSNDPILTECADGTVQMGGNCKRR